MPFFIVSRQPLHLHMFFDLGMLRLILRCDTADMCAVCHSRHVFCVTQ